MMLDAWCQVGTRAIETQIMAQKGQRVTSVTQKEN